MGNTIVSGRALIAAPASYRTGTGTPLTAADSNTWATPIVKSGDNGSAQPTKDNPTLEVSPRFSVAGATAELACGLWRLNGDPSLDASWQFLGISGILDAAAHSSQQDGDSRYIGTEVLPFDLCAATHYELRVVSISSGNVVLVPWLNGPAPQGPESVS